MYISMFNKALIGIIIFLLTASQVHAMQTEEYLSHITDLVYDSCNEKDIKLKDNFFIKADNSGFIVDLKWPYDITLIKDTIDYISISEPYAVSRNSWFTYGDTEVGNKSVKIDGRGYNILVCGDNRLDVFSRDYYWNDRKIELPRNVQINEGGKATFGDRSPFIEINAGDNSKITTGDRSPINEENILIQLFWSKGTIGGGLIVIVLNILYKYWKKRLRKSSLAH